MRRFLFMVVGVVALAVSSVGVAGEAVAAQDAVFSGTWTSVDTDGSNQTLRIAGSGNGAYGMFLFDDSATAACGGRPAYVVGKGVADGDTLVMYGTLVCLPGGDVLRHRLSFTLVYSSGDDTLVDEAGVVWYRE